MSDHLDLSGLYTLKIRVNYIGFAMARNRINSLREDVNYVENIFIDSRCSDTRHVDFGHYPEEIKAEPDKVVEHFLESDIYNAIYAENDNTFVLNKVKDGLYVVFPVRPIQTNDHQVIYSIEIIFEGKPV